MAHVFYGNFDFEHELSSSSYNRPRRMKRLNDELTTHFLAMADDGDRLTYSCEPPSGFLSDAASGGFPRVQVGWPERRQAPGIDLVPWGWSDSAVELAASCGCVVDAPAVDAVRTANSRCFSYEQEQTRRSRIPGSTTVDSPASLEMAVLEAAAIWDIRVDDFCWLLKADLSMSGRERISGKGTHLNDLSINWVRRRLKMDGSLYFEPHVVPQCELSTQWKLERLVANDRGMSPPELIGVTQLLTDHSGQYLGSVLVDAASVAGFSAVTSDFCLSRDLLNHVIGDARSVAVEVQGLGYHGPLGIDAMVYRGPDGTSMLRSIQDVNARLTMGRIALEWFRHFPGSDQPAWLLVPEVWLRDHGSMRSIADNSRLLTSPPNLAGRSVSRVGVLMKDSADWQRLLATHL